MSGRAESLPDRPEPMGAKPYLHRFTVLGLLFVRRPVSEAAPEGTMGMVDNGHPNGWTDRMVATFKDGAWVRPNGKPLRFVPNYWTVLDLEQHRGA